MHSSIPGKVFQKKLGTLTSTLQGQALRKEKKKKKKNINIKENTIKLIISEIDRTKIVEGCLGLAIDCKQIIYNQSILIHGFAVAVHYDRFISKCCFINCS